MSLFFYNHFNVDFIIRNEPASRQNRNMNEIYNSEGFTV